MANIKIVESVVKSYLDGDNKPLIEAIENEINSAKKLKQHAAVKKLRDLLKLVPNKHTYKAQSYTNIFSKENNDDNPLVKKIKSDIQLEDVVLDDSSKELINVFLNEWEQYEKLSRHNIFPTNKLLFYGPPGTGKTMLAYAIGNKLELPVILVRLDELISSYLGKTGKNIRDIFQIAENESVIIFLDEIDTIAKNRDDERELGELKRIVTVLLQNIDSFPNNSILIGATNHEAILDKALWRRFSTKLRFENPSLEERVKLFRLYLSNYKNNIDYALVGKLTEGLNGSVIRDICIDIKKKAVLKGVNKLVTLDAVNVILIMSKFSNTHLKIPKQRYYDMCKILKGNGYSIKEIESISGIPYTTLIDNI